MGSLQRKLSANPRTGRSSCLQEVDLTQPEEAVVGEGDGGQESREESFPGLHEVRYPSPAQLAMMPTHLMVLCCVPWYRVQRPREWVLRCQELDALLAWAMSPKFYEPDQLQELKIENLDPGDIQLLALNEWHGHGSAYKQACVQPIP